MDSHPVTAVNITFPPDAKFICSIEVLIKHLYKMEILFKNSAENGELKDADIPFKLCFKSKVPLGRSYAHLGLSTKIPLPITPKFYSKTTGVKGPFEAEKIADTKRSLQAFSPNKKYERPLTENQKYGWYDINFLNTSEIQGPKLDFRIKRNQLIIEHLMNHAKIRE